MAACRDPDTDLDAALATAAASAGATGRLGCASISNAGFVLLKGWPVTQYATIHWVSELMCQQGSQMRGVL